MKKLVNVLFAVAILVSASSCIKEKLWDDVQGKGKAEVILRLKTPNGYSTPKSRALTFAQENTINDIYVLVFNSANNLATIKQGLGVASTPGSSNPAYSGEGSFTEPSKRARTRRIPTTSLCWPMREQSWQIPSASTMLLLI